MREPELALEGPPLAPAQNPDPLGGLCDEDGEAVTDQRAMDQARALGTARSVYGLEAAGRGGPDLSLGD
ncbi:hypothetical protein LRS12_01570 [Sphingomonas sp. J344]|nr:hypothetical protein [Sphingomonas sp. J344]